MGVGNGYDALKLILMAHNIKKNDEIIVSSHTFIATWHSISSIGAIPIPVDSDYDTYNIDVEKIETKINKKTKAIVGVHLYGQPIDSDKVKFLCKKYKLYYFEDASQAHGAMYKNKSVGSLGDAAAFSFYPTKNIGALGDAGAITTNNFKIYKKLIRLRNYGKVKNYNYEFIGLNSRLDEIQAVFLNFKLKKYKYLLTLKKNIVNYYNKNLLVIDNEIELPRILPNIEHVWHHYVVKFRRRNKIVQFLEENGFKTMIHYPIPPHMTRSYSNLNIKKGDLINTEILSKRILSLPTYDLNLAKRITLKINIYLKKKLKN